MKGPIHVIKIGGSLFDFDDLPQKLDTWLQEQPFATQVLVAGGGPFADVVRDLDRRFDIGEKFGHWICVGLLDTTARLLARILGRVELVEWNELRTRLADSQRERFMLQVEAFLRGTEPLLPAPPLAQSWSTTTDSIAARVALALDAEKLVLLKSNSAGQGTSRGQAANEGFVDPQFPTASRGLRVRWVNLRADPIEEGELG